MGKGDVKKSAIYVVGHTFIYYRLCHMTKIKDQSRKTLLCARRDNWITHLSQRIHTGKNFHRSHTNRLFAWAKNPESVDALYFQTNVCHWRGPRVYGIPTEPEL